MPNNLIETAKNYFSSEFINQTSSSFGETNVGITKALSAIVPACFAGILNKATSSSDDANSIFKIAKEASENLEPSNTLDGLQSQESKGGEMFSQLFGSKQSEIISSISQFAGIKDVSAGSLLKMGLPVIMGLLGQYAKQHSLSPSGLSGFILSQKDHIQTDMPHELSSLGSLLGIGTSINDASSMSSSLESKAADTSLHNMNKPSGGSSKWLMPLIIIVAIIGALFFFLRTCNNPKETISLRDSSAEIEPITTVAMGVYMKVKLPNGKELDAFQGGIEDQLVNFLNSDWKAMSTSTLKAKWFNFDGLTFETDKATLIADSEMQLDNLAEILKAFPDAKIKIGGYTDALGDAMTNKKLSQDRADAAKEGLIKRGVGAQVISAEGYGSQFAIATANAPDIERALDRRVSVSVRK
jgi:outer membrane protein OmpA-like peptidoglycan-associated protein